MKKITLYRWAVALMTTIAFMGCAKDAIMDDEPSIDVTQKDKVPVAFETSVSLFDADTRAEITSKSDLAISGFGVFSYYHDGTGTTDGAYSSSSTPNFMYNQEITSADAGVSWTYSPIKYWPNETTTDGNGATSEHTDKLSFLAYAPYTSVLSGTDPGIYAFTSVTAAGDAKVSYRVSPDDPSKGVDLMWAVDPTTGQPLLNLTKKAIGEKVNMKFYHALTKLDIKAQLSVEQLPGGGTLDPNTKVYVEGLYLIPQQTDADKLLGLEGNFNLNTTYSSSSSAGWEITTKYDATAANNNNIKIKDAKKYGAGGAGVTTTSESLLDGPLMFIPINGSATYKYNVRLVYHVVTGTSDVTNDIVQENVEIPFLQGTGNTLVAIIGLTSVKFTVSVSNWTDDTKAVTLRSTDEVF